MTAVENAKRLCGEYGFTEIRDSSVAPGFVATHPNGYKAAVLEAGDFSVYRRHADRSWQGKGLVGLGDALARAGDDPR